MAQRIDHITTEGVINAWECTHKPHWAIFAGREIVIAHDSETAEDAAEMLSNYLEMLKDGGSSCIYTLKIYGEKSGEITSKTAASGSTTFMLNNKSALRQNPDGTTFIIDNARNNTTPGQPMVGYSALQAEVQSLRAELNRERELRHKADLQALETRFNAQISGIAAAQPELQWWEKALNSVEKITEKPEVMERISSLFNGGKKREWIKPQIQQPAPQQRIPAATQMAGTRTTEEPAPDQEQEQVSHGEDLPQVDEIIYLNNFLTDQERNLKSSKKYDIVLQKLEALHNEEQIALQSNPPAEDEDEESDLIEIQNNCAVHLEGRIGRPTVTLLMLAVQGMDDDDLKKLLNHLL